MSAIDANQQSENLKAIVDCVVLYYEKRPTEDVDIGSPFVGNLDDFTEVDRESLVGEIAISGAYKGWVRYMAPEMMVRHICISIGEQNPGEEHIRSMVGEIANTVAGNLRKHVGPEFHISTPDVFRHGEKGGVDNGEAVYIIPVSWKNYKSYLIAHWG